MDVSNVVQNQDIVAGHYVNEVSKKISWINLEAFSIFAPSFGFFLEYASMFVVAFLFAYLLGLYLKQRRPWQFPVRLFYNLFSPEDPEFTRSSAVGVLFVFTLFFLFLVEQIIGNNIKTEVGFGLCDGREYEDSNFNAFEMICFFLQNSESDR